MRLNHLIGGRAVVGDIVHEQRNPASPDDLVVEVPGASPQMALEAIAAARQAIASLDAGGIEARADALTRISRSLVAASAWLSLLIARETGKTIVDARGEVLRACAVVRFLRGRDAAQCRRAL